jgi:signal transduction histidine kinase
MHRGPRNEGRGGDPLPPELEELLALTAHELHEPLRKIATFGELLRRRAGGTLDDESRDYVLRMERAAERMRGTLDSMIAFARVPRGLPFVTIDLAEVVAGAVEKTREPIRLTGAAVEIAALPAIEGDPFQMQQLFEHLLDNAIKFRREGVSPIIRIDATPAAAEGGTHLIRVADNGQGFDDTLAERIFRPFERLHGRGKYPGAGLGLAICRKIAERHGAQLTARGTPGEGAVVTLTVPVARPRKSSPGTPP